MWEVTISELHVHVGTKWRGGGGLFMKSGTGKCGGWVGVSSLVPKAGGEDIYIDFQFKCNVKRGTFAYCLTHLDSNNIIMTIAELLEKE